MSNLQLKERMPENQRHSWHLKLFEKSLLKQAKLAQIKAALPTIEGTTCCLDLGSDNGVISYYLREIGGEWHSADLTPSVVESIRSLVQERVSLFDGKTLPYADCFFDIVVIVDMLEHVSDESQFVRELARVLKPGGTLVVNAPNLKKRSPLRLVRHLIGQTDEAHGHLRAGYGLAELRSVFGSKFDIQASHTYSRFFVEFIDTCIVAAYSLLNSRRAGAQQPKKNDEVSKGLVFTEADMKRYEKTFRLYSYIYPLVCAFAALDKCIPFISGFMRLTVVKRAS